MIHSKNCQWSNCSCGHLAQEHDTATSCNVPGGCKRRCRGYDGRETHHEEGKSVKFENDARGLICPWCTVRTLISKCRHNPFPLMEQNTKLENDNMNLTDSNRGLREALDEKPRDLVSWLEEHIQFCEHGNIYCRSCDRT